MTLPHEVRIKSILNNLLKKAGDGSYILEIFFYEMHMYAYIYELSTFQLSG
jgi:hypothetical protein